MPILIVGDPEIWGLIPGFLDEDDPRPAREQFAANYIAGWQPFEGFTANEDMVLSYPGDPPLEPQSMMIFRNEVLFIYDHAWVVILQHDKSWEIMRMD
jgi:hypothetical protein